MALTEAQIDSVFEICELPRSTTVETPQGAMGLTGMTFRESNTEFQLQRKIEGRLASLSISQLSKLGEYIERWDAMGTSTTTISGSVGGIGGVDFSPTDELVLIQKRVMRLIGVYQIIDEIKSLNQRTGAVVPLLN